MWSVETILYKYILYIPVRQILQLFFPFLGVSQYVTVTFSLPSSPPSCSSMALHHDLGVLWVGQVTWRWMKKWYLLMSWWTKRNLGFSLILDVAYGWGASLQKFRKRWWNRGKPKIGTQRVFQLLVPLQVPPCHKRSCSPCPPHQSQPIELDVDSA